VTCPKNGDYCPKHGKRYVTRDPLRMWACVGWYVLICLAGAIGLACWGWA
jgi:hypothetical protein